jgi:hypothetical protein
MMRGGAFWQLLSLSLFWRMLVLQFATLVVWDVAGEWFEINASQVSLPNVDFNAGFNCFENRSFTFLNSKKTPMLY